MRAHLARVAAICGLILVAALPAAAQLVVPYGQAFTITTSPNSDTAGRTNIATDGTDFVVSWKDASAQIMASRVTPDGVVVATTSAPLGRTPDSYTQPAIAFDGTNFLVVWVGSDNGPLEIFAARLSPSLEILDSPARKLTTGGDPKPRPIPLAFGGGTYLTAWRDGSDRIRVARVTTTGDLVEAPAGLLVTGTGGRFYPWIAYGGGVFLVAYHGWGSGGLDVFGTRITPDGTVLGPAEFVISASPHDEHHVGVASDGTDFLVEWQDKANSTDLDGWTFGTRVTAAGTVLDTPFLIGERSHQEGPATPVFDGTNYFVVWMTAYGLVDYRLADAFGRRVSTSGVVLDQQAVPVATSFSHQWGATVGYVNNRYLAVWHECSQIRCGGGTGWCVGAQLLSRESGTSPPLNTPTPGSGQTWTLDPMGATSDLYSVYGLDDGTAFAVGEAPDGYNIPWWRYSGGTWSVWATVPIGRFHGLWASAPDNAWATGGGTWSYQHDGSTVQLYYCDGCWPPEAAPMSFGIWGDSSGSLIAVGTNGHGRQYIPATVPWTQPVGWRVFPEIGTTFDLSDVWATSPTNVYAVGERGTILRYDGAAWSQETGVPTFQSLSGIWGTSPTNVYAVGDYGTILHFDGTSWTHQNSGTLEHLHGIWGLRPNEIYVVGNGGTILHFDGTTWLHDTSPTADDLFDVWGSAVTGTLWAVGRGGVTMKKTGAGAGCTFAVGSAGPFGQAGGTAQVPVTTACTWTAFSEVPWLSVTSGASGTGAGTVSLSVEPNYSGAQRTGTVRIGSEIVTVDQTGDGCTFDVSPKSVSLNANGYQISVAITTQPGCHWGGTAPALWWLRVQNVSTTVGPGTATLGIGWNSESAPQSGSVTLAGQVITVEQAAPTTPGCAFFVWPGTRAHDAGWATGNLTLDATQASCAWTAETSTPWLRITGPTSGQGPGGTTYEVDPNPLTTSRSGTIVMAGSTITITQAANAGISLVMPARGVVAGGTRVRIVGPSFPGGASVTIGGASAGVVSETATEIVVLAPAHTAGEADVTVAGGGGFLVTAPAGFLYVSPPPASRPTGDFDRDALADVVVYRPASGTWFWLESSANRTSYAYRGWGMEIYGDIPVRGDFDGDGVVDPTVYRPASGTWFVLRSSANFSDWTWWGWGIATDTPIPGDYDGDGMTDAAVFRAATGTWYVRPSSGATPWSVGFGQSGDVPVPGDFDGDGKRDPAVYRPSTGTWFWLKSSSAYAEFEWRGWGIQAEGDTPIPGDYDGDRTSDLAVYRPGSGTWFILESHAAFTTWTWCGLGTAADVPMPADYNGDGRTDVAIHRPSTGEWFVKPSGGAAPWSVVFGQAGDVPLHGIR